MRAQSIAAFAVAILSTSGCSSTPAWGGQGQDCYPNDTCNAGLTCTAGKCVPGGAGGGTANGGGMGGGGGGGAGGGIAALPGLVLWLDAAKGVSGTSSVTAWADQSSAHNDLSGSGASLSGGAVNGYPAVSFSSATMQSANNPSFGFGAGELVIEAVARVNGTHSQIFGTSAMRLQSATAGGFAQVQLGASTFVSSTTNVADGMTWRLIGMRRSGADANTTVEVRLGGVVGGTDTGIQDSYNLGASTPAFIGGSDTLEDIAEVVVIKGTISVSDLATLEGYLKTKYGL